MNDIKKKLDGLAAQLGMVPANTLRPGAPVSKRRLPEAPHSADSADEQEIPESGGMLSAAMASQLRARLGLEREANLSPPHGGPEEGIAIEAMLPGEIVGDGSYGFFLYRRTFPLDFQVGDVSLRAGLSCNGAQIALSACDEQLKSFDPQKTCYVDTETTGLAGGAGTVAFLVGLGYFHDDAFLLEQCFLRDYDDEEPMLSYLAGKFQEFDCIVSYNGKSFDLPLLRTRFVQHRLAFPLAQTGHYDLVHAARRVWKKRLSDCSLNNIERLILGFQRHDDVPGYLIPQLWLDYLATGDARPLEGVFSHHAMDILSLAALAGHLSQRLAATDGPAFHHAEDQLSVIRLYYKNKDYPAVLEHARHFLETSRIADALRRECLFLSGQAAKRMGQFEDMHDAWKSLHEEFLDDCTGAAELAKYLEHQLRDFGAAARVCRETLDALEHAHAEGNRAGDFTASALRGRLKRLETKIARKDHSENGDKDIFFDG